MGRGDEVKLLLAPWCVVNFPWRRIPGVFYYLLQHSALQNVIILL